MIEIPKIDDDTDSQYDGSRIFTWLADTCGLSVDLVSERKRKIISALFYLIIQFIKCQLIKVYDLKVGKYYSRFD